MKLVVGSHTMKSWPYINHYNNKNYGLVETIIKSWPHKKDLAWRQQLNGGGRVKNLDDIPKYPKYVILFAVVKGQAFSSVDIQSARGNRKKKWSKKHSIGNNKRYLAYLPRTLC